jgi:hypothetical protein
MLKLGVDNQIDYDLGLLFFELFTLRVEGLYLYLGCQSVCLFVRIGSPAPEASVSPPLGTKGVATLSCGERA